MSRCRSGRLSSSPTRELDFDTPAAVKTEVVDGCIRYADELIDAHLRGRYTLPLAEIPTVLRDIAITLVRYRLYTRRPGLSGHREG